MELCRVKPPAREFGLMTGAKKPGEPSCRFEMRGNEVGCAQLATASIK